MHKTKIDWCDWVFNPVWGCRNECPYCYARKTAKRYGFQVTGRDDFVPTWIEKNFQRPMPKQPSRIFVNSMSDIAFWEPDWWEKVERRIRENPQHTFLFLTKAPRIYYAHSLPMNCWLGVTTTTQVEVDIYQENMFYLPNLCFLSIEPILEKIDPQRIKPYSINWVILAAESGNRKERIIPPPEWIEPFLSLPIPLYMKHNLPWSGPWRKEFPA